MRGAVTLVCICYIVHKTELQQIQPTGISQVGMPLTLSCIRSQLHVNGKFYKNNTVGEVTTCMYTFMCTPNPSFPTYSFSANLTGMYLEISSLSRDQDEASWTCVIETSMPMVSNELFVYVNSPLNNENITVDGNSIGSVTVTCTMICQYPAFAVSVEILYSVDGSSYDSLSSQPTRSATNGTGSGCRDYEEDLVFTATLSQSTSGVNCANNIFFKCRYTHSNLNNSVDGKSMNCEVSTSSGSSDDSVTMEPLEQNTNTDEQSSLTNISPEVSTMVPPEQNTNTGEQSSLTVLSIVFEISCGLALISFAVTSI